VGIGRAVLAAVLVDGEGALDYACRPANGALDGVPQDELSQPNIEPGAAVGRTVVDGQDEAEVDGVALPCTQTELVLERILSWRTFQSERGETIMPASSRICLWHLASIA
jgi:hypothetical protein